MQEEVGVVTELGGESIPQAAIPSSSARGLLSLDGTGEAGFEHLRHKGKREWRVSLIQDRAAPSDPDRVERLAVDEEPDAPSVGGQAAMCGGETTTKEDQ